MALCSIYKYGSKAQGLAFLAFGSISFLLFVYAAIVSKLLPPFDSPILAAIQNDRAFVSSDYCIDQYCRVYYCFLVPLTLPILVVKIYFHWLSMKIFKHA